MTRALLVLAACGHPAPPAPPTASVDDPDLGDPPTMIASGAPVHITVPPQQVGMTFVRDIDDVDGSDVTTDGVHGHEQLHRHYVLESTIVEASGHEIHKLAIATRTATEIHERDGQRTEGATLHGNYIADSRGEDFAIERADKVPLDVGERAALNELFYGQLSRFETLARAAPEHALRVGETDKLDDFAFHNSAGEQVVTPVHVTLLAATDRTATYQIDMHFADALFEIRARITASVKIGDGTLIAVHGYARRIDNSEHEQVTERRSVAITYEVLSARTIKLGWLEPSTTAFSIADPTVF